MATIWITILIYYVTLGLIANALLRRALTRRLEVGARIIVIRQLLEIVIAMPLCVIAGMVVGQATHPEYEPKMVGRVFGPLGGRVFGPFTELDLTPFFHSVSLSYVKIGLIPVAGALVAIGLLFAMLSTAIVFGKRKKIYNVEWLILIGSVLALGSWASGPLVVLSVYPQFDLLAFMLSFSALKAFWVYGVGYFLVLCAAALIMHGKPNGSSERKAYAPWLAAG